MTKVIYLGRTRELLGAWEEVRRAIMSGQISGLYAGLRTITQAETIFLAGEYRDDPMEAMKGILKASAATTKREEDDPPSSLVSTM